MPVLNFRVRLEATDVPLDVLCAGYELKTWRADALVSDVFDRHLLSFAMSYSAFQSVTGHTALQALREAAISVYSTDKYGSRGEFGELLLHGALMDFYGASPAVSKIYYEDTANHVVKGFDSVHLVVSNDEPRIWLGEAKFYASLNQAVDAALSDIKAHLDSDFLRKEFMFISRKIDDQWPGANQFRKVITAAKSLDEIASAIIMPIFLTYDSNTVDRHDVVSPEYVADLTQEGQAALLRFESKLVKPLEVELRLILMPLESKSRLVELMNAKLEALRGI